MKLKQVQHWWYRGSSVLQTHRINMVVALLYFNMIFAFHKLINNPITQVWERRKRIMNHPRILTKDQRHHCQTRSLNLRHRQATHHNTYGPRVTIASSMSNLGIGDWAQQETHLNGVENHHIRVTTSRQGFSGHWMSKNSRWDGCEKLRILIGVGYRRCTYHRSLGHHWCFYYLHRWLWALSHHTYTLTHTHAQPNRKILERYFKYEKFFILFWVWKIFDHVFWVWNFFLFESCSKRCPFWSCFLFFFFFSCFERRET